MKIYIFIISTLYSIICFSYPIFSNTNINIRILEKKSYIIGYSMDHNLALWCMYNLNRDQLLASNKVARTNNFRKDTEITNSITIKPTMYNRSGYDKGHLCPAQDRNYNIEDVSETFLMSNMCPQDPGFNRGVWKKLEDYTRKCAIANTNITVITGPVIFNKHFNLYDISVPHMFYKIIIFNKYKIECYLIPNQKCNLNFDKYKIDLEYLKNLLEMEI